MYPLYGIVRSNLILAVQSVGRVPESVLYVEGGHEASGRLHDEPGYNPGRALHPHRLIEAGAAEAVIASQRPAVDR